MKDLAASPDPDATGKPSGIPKKGPPPKRGILKMSPKYQGPPRTGTEAPKVASAKGLPFMKGELDNTAELGSYGMGKTPPPRKAVLRPEDPIGNNGHSRERPEELKIRVLPSKSQRHYYKGISVRQY